MTVGSVVGVAVGVCVREHAPVRRAPATSLTRIKRTKPSARDAIGRQRFVPETSCARRRPSESSRFNASLASFAASRSGPASAFCHTVATNV